MSLVRGVFLVVPALSLLMFSPASSAQSFKPVGGLDCNGHSLIQKPLRPQDSCTDFKGEYGTRGYDNGYYGRPGVGVGIGPKTLSPSGSPWHSATPIQVLCWGRASRIVTRTIPSLPGLRSSKCSSIHPGILPSSPKSVAT